jgi:hypothetical protein
MGTISETFVDGQGQEFWCGSKTQLKKEENWLSAGTTWTDEPGFGYGFGILQWNGQLFLNIKGLAFPVPTHFLCS